MAWDWVVEFHFSGDGRANLAYHTDTKKVAVEVATKLLGQQKGYFSNGNLAKVIRRKDNVVRAKFRRVFTEHEQRIEEVKS